MTRTSVHGAAKADDDRLYDPPWARQRDLPVGEGHPSRRSPIVADVASPLLSDRSARSASLRMPTGIGGPNIEYPSTQQPEPATPQRLLSRLSYEPGDQPERPVLTRPKSLWRVGRLAFCIL